MTLEKKCEAGLWFDVAAAMHYKVANFSDFKQISSNGTFENLEQ
jgi:hypothetical protein